MAENVVKKAAAARSAFLKASVSSSRQRNLALKKIVAGLKKNKGKIFAANAKDLKAAEKSGLVGPLFKRLQLNNEKFREILREVEGVEKQRDLAGKAISVTLLDKGLELSQVATPLGVICAIFESRPDALVQISALSIKTGNSVILKGGSEAKNTNRVLASVVREALHGAGLPTDSVQLIEARSSVKKILSLNEFIDLIIPRGSNAFVKFIQKNSSIPVLGHSEGVCHEFVDESADLQKAVKICVDAKVQYPAVCNAMETLLVHRKIAAKFLPEYAKALNGKVELRCDNNSFAILKKAGFKARKASKNDWRAEYNDYILSIKVVGGIVEAIAHVNTFGSKHTDGIITENRKNAEKFLAAVDSAGVFWNASTRFSDGYRYGKGAEVGISTGKIHARGPSGAESLLTYKYVLKGPGKKAFIVGDYVGRGAKKFLHKKVL